jgi:hypothetical protein
LLGLLAQPGQLTCHLAGTIKCVAGTNLIALKKSLRCLLEKEELAYIALLKHILVPFGY